MALKSKNKNLVIKPSFFPHGISASDVLKTLFPSAKVTRDSMGHDKETRHRVWKINCDEISPVSIKEKLLSFPIDYQTKYEERQQVRQPNEEEETSKSNEGSSKD